MSVHSVAPVWTNSAASGNDLVVLLALADMANDGYGFAWSRISFKDDDGIPRGLAVKARLSKSACYERLYALVEMGELRMFRRGHYRSPAFVITIVDSPLDDDGIRRRLSELDSSRDWHEVTPNGDEVPFHLQRSSGTRTISENHITVSIPEEPQAHDQEVQPPDPRENPESIPPREIVRNQDDLTDPPSRSSSQPDKIVQPAGQDRPASRTTKGTVLGTVLPTTTTDAHSDGGGGGDAPHPEEIAERWCRLRGVRFIGKIAEIYPRQVARFLEEHPPPSDEFLERALEEGIKHPSGWMFVTGAAGSQANRGELPDCERCDNRRLLGLAPNGHLVKADSEVDYETMVPCPECMFRDREAVG